MNWEIFSVVSYKLSLTKSIPNDWITKAFAVCLYGEWPHAAIAVNLKQPLREIRVQWDTVLQGIWCNRSLDSWRFFSSLPFRRSVMSDCATPWITARQAFLSITDFWSPCNLMSIESVMPSSHLILCCPLLLLPPIPPSIRVFSN